MDPKNQVPTMICLVLIHLVAISGCDERVAKIAREASDRQADQNRQMAELQQEVARGTSQLVKSDAAARENFVNVHRDLQQERSQLVNNWNELELERQRVDGQRRSDSGWQFVVTVTLGSLVVAAFFSYLRRLLVSADQNESVDAEVAALLVDQLLPDRPLAPGNTENPEEALASDPSTALPPFQMSNPLP